MQISINTKNANMQTGNRAFGIENVKEGLGIINSIQRPGLVLPILFAMAIIMIVFVWPQGPITETVQIIALIVSGLIVLGAVGTYLFVGKMESGMVNKQSEAIPMGEENVES